jgi:hypothetical protein
MMKKTISWDELPIGKDGQVANGCHHRWEDRNETPARLTPPDNVGTFALYVDGQFKGYFKAVSIEEALKQMGT